MAKPNLGTLNSAARRAGVKPLTASQVQRMSRGEINAYIRSGRKVARINRKSFKKDSREVRRNARTEANAQFKEKKLLHGTIRQGFAEMASLGASGIGTAYSNAVTGAKNAISQNTSGGTNDTTDTDQPTITEHGPVYSIKGRSED